MTEDPEQEAEEKWVAEQREIVVSYLQAEGVQGQVGEWPAWDLAPYVAVFAIESVANPGRVGWWAISGDLPTDYVSSDGVADPREALQRFARNWTEASEYMIRGEQPPKIKIGPPERWPELGELLSARAQLLRDFAADPSIWDF